MTPEIIKETPDYIVINKPAGLMVHADGRSDEKTLCDFLDEKYPEISNSHVGESMKVGDGKEIFRPGIVHRLDRDTSGVMVVARTARGFEYLKKLFQDRQIKKTYHAFVYGNIKNDEGVIDAPIGRSKKDFRQWFATIFQSKSTDRVQGNKTRDAVTEYSVLRRAEDKSVTFVEARPLTGRTHQIRVHFKAMNNPLVADSLYASGRGNALGFDRVALHAKSISFVDLNGESVSYEAPYPKDFAAAVEGF